VGVPVEVAFEVVGHLIHLIYIIYMCVHMCVYVDEWERGTRKDGGVLYICVCMHEWEREVETMSGSTAQTD
jgi:hypothetical protein